MTNARAILDTFTIESLPNLDVVTRGALELFAAEPQPPLRFPYLRPLVLGSGNAAIAGHILFRNTQAVFADESNYERCLDAGMLYDAVVIMSASGSKHAVPMVAAAQARELPVVLITNNPTAPAAAHAAPECIHLFPKNREPYTYNTSTYLGPILANTGEEAGAISVYLTKEIDPLLLRNFENYSAVTFLIPATFELVRPMVRTKFDELFGPMLTGRIFTDEEVKHAKTVVVSGEELFISLGVENRYYGVPKNRLQLPLMDGAGYGAMIATLYYIIGKIQQAHPPYFAQHIEAYCKTASEIFGSEITPIVE